MAELNTLCRCADRCYRANLPTHVDCRRRLPRIDRPPREQTFMEVAETIRKRSTCLRGKVGVVIVNDNRIIATGYNGAPPGAPHCFELGCDVDENVHDAGCERAIHAEANAIAWSARAGVSTTGAHLYTTHSPCLKCAQLIVSCGITRVYWARPYRLVAGVELLEQLGVELSQVSLEGDTQAD